MQTSNIAGYKFITLTNLSSLQTTFMQNCQDLDLKGTILLSEEGINLSLAGSVENIITFKNQLHTDNRFSDMTFRESQSTHQPFKRLKIKIKKEIITLRRPEVQPAKKRASEISPEEFKHWLDEKRDITILDTRNDYEVKFGTFNNAIDLHIKDFCEFIKATETLSKEKPIVMFCTGGVRCEKAGLHLLNQGFPEVYQLDGGILNYFAKVGGAHYQGECFVFDERVALDSNLQRTGTVQCKICQGPVKHPTQTCSACHSHLM
jgi:predicted sulfurtransferase